MATMPWVKLYTEILDDPKMGNMSDEMKWRFIQLVLLAGECDSEGVIPMSWDDIAWRLREEPEKIKNAICFLCEQDLLNLSDPDAYVTVINFSKRQGRSQSEKRKQWRERQKRYRDKIRKDVYDRGGGTCEYCGTAITYDGFVVDHLLPPFRGGEPSDLNNLVASCRSCNTLKGDKTPEEAVMINPRQSDVTPMSRRDIGNVTLLEEIREDKEEEQEGDVVDIFTAYEANIGALTPMLSEQIKDWEENYAHSWIIEAIEAAVMQEVRKPAYITAILKNWHTNGKGKPGEKPPDPASLAVEVWT